MLLYLNGYSDNEHWPDGPIVCVVDLTPELAQKFLDRRLLYEQIEAADPQIFRLEFWDLSAEFLHALDLEDFCDAPDDALIPNPEIKEEDQLRTECDSVFIGEYGARFECRDKYSSCSFDATEIPWPDIAAAARGESTPFLDARKAETLMALYEAAQQEDA